ncbi:maintenance of ploidy protein MOB1 [Vigna unguiculata]|uniref:Maintenance of ploidy protein MOB1 n=2 Tax=Vigna TaxID=3913 RepID=A0A4D6NJN7_VIGUN|nr:maintenance of ploidy protein MOB1 [Vigna unguiculata]
MQSNFDPCRNQKTFRPKKSAPSGSKGAQLQKHIDATLGSGNLREAVKLPPGEDINEWLAVNTVDFFNQVNILFGTLTEFCTANNCPTMSAGPKNQKTFRPKKSAPSGSKGAQLQKHIDATLGSGNLREAVKLPPGEDINEWLAVNTVDFFNQVNILFGTLTEFCTANNCPTMSAGPKYEYRWADGVTIKKPIEVSAPKYVEYLMDWIESQLDDETIFPQRLGAPFPSNFRDVVKTIFKRLFRVYAHIYHSHFQKIVSLKEEAHLNTCFKHFVLFTWEFRLIDKAELAPLEDLVESIIQL